MSRAEPGQSGRLIATLLTNTPLRALEISRSGCLLEGSYPIEAGTAGKLRLAIGGRTYSEDARVTRCERIEGSAAYRLGVEFLRTRPPSATSLRRVLLSMLDAKDKRVFGDDSKVT